MEFHSFNKVRMICPVIFKYENTSSGNTAAKVDNIGCMIRGGLRQRLHRCTWIFQTPTWITEYPVKFDQKGTSCMLLQVKDLPLKGMSTNSRSKIRSLNFCISLASPPTLFLSSTDLYRLKSPTRSQSSKLVVSRFKSQVMKANFPEAWEGPYMLLREKRLLSSLLRNLTVTQ